MSTYPSQSDQIVHAPDVQLKAFALRDVTIMSRRC